MALLDYYVRIFLDDVKITNDYSNVLDFADESSRDNYFDNLKLNKSVTFPYVGYHLTSYVNLAEIRNTIKLSIYEGEDFSYTFDPDKASYMYIESYYPYSSSEGKKIRRYYFIESYRIISANENNTVVEFYIVQDIWTNYQFNIKMHECNISRMHVDRWDGRNISYTKPTLDMIETAMVVNKEEELADTKQFYVRLNTSQTGINTVERQFALALITYLESNQIKLFCYPVILDTTHIMPLWRSLNTTPMRRYPDLYETMCGHVIKRMNLTPSGVVSIQLIQHSGCLINSTINETVLRYVNSSGVETDIGDDNSITNNVDIDGQTITYFMYNLLPDISSIFLQNYDFSRMFPWKSDEIHTINVSLPIPPVYEFNFYLEPFSGSYLEVATNLNQDLKNEIALYRTPVMKRYLVTSNGEVITEIPDSALLETEDFRSYTKIHYKNMISYTSGYNYVYFEGLEDIKSLIVINAISRFPTHELDILNDKWLEYKNTERDTDRKMMWSNILTGGLADAGSTAISAGIGYRSNEERAQLTQILHGGNAKGNEVNMYRSFAKQALGMSVAGGMAQFGASAINSYMTQSIKEEAIQNKPATLAQSTEWVSRLVGDEYNDAYIETVADITVQKQYGWIFYRYGYAINGVDTPNIKSRKYFNYIKTNGAIITGPYNQSVLSSIGSILDNGVTIWHMDVCRYTDILTTPYNPERSSKDNNFIVIDCANPISMCITTIKSKNDKITIYYYNKANLNSIVDNTYEATEMNTDTVYKQYTVSSIQSFPFKLKYTFNYKDNTTKDIEIWIYGVAND